jgi:myosin-1
MTAGEVIEIVSKEDNGWWLGRKNGVEAWVPANYVEERKVTRAAPPAPPAAASKTSAAPNGGQAGGMNNLAAALKTRNQAVNGADDEDDW